jgi:phenylalanyl-tRNA synthetase alpha subunit
MGGRRYTKMKLKQERQEKLRLVEKVRSNQRVIVALRTELEGLLESVAPGIRSTFADKVKASERWLSKTAQLDVTTLSTADAHDKLKTAAAQLQKTADRGRTLVRETSVAFTQKADAMADKLAKQLTDVRSLLVEHRDNCRQWFPERVADWENQMAQTEELLYDENYSRAGRELQKLRDEITKTGNEVAQVAEKCHARMYVLKALRQVCCDLGFEEVDEPTYETQGDRTSRIRFAIRSVARGELSFALSLDGISSFGAADRCYEDLDQVSDFLLSEFGVGTRFRATEDDAPPKRKERRALELPDDYQASAEA